MTTHAPPSERLILMGIDFPALRPRLEALAPVVTLAELDGADLDGGVDRARIAVLVTGGMAPLDTALLDRLPGLGMVAVPAAGYAGIDLDDARRRGLTVANVSAVNHEDVADIAIGLMIMLARGLLRGHRMVTEGGWTIGGVPLASSIRGRRAGILGMGSIGQAIARRLDAFGCAVAWWGPNPKDLAYPRAADLPALAERSDMLFVAAAENRATRGIVDRAVLDRLGPGGLLINVARGGLVDEEALIAALADGRIGGAGLDVFAAEPTPPARWRGLDNVVLAPHLGGLTRESIAGLLERTVDNVARYLEGLPLPHAVCGPDVPARSPLASGGGAA